MIRALAIETSSRVGSVALALDGAAIGQQTFASGLQHAARIVPAIDELCKEADWKSDSINEIYVSAGPGSFTGLRIGITLAKTYAWATGAKLVAVPTVNVLVENAPAEAKDVVIVIDAKRDQIFTARFSRSESGWIEQQPAHLDTLSEMLRQAPRPVYLLGEGIPFHRKFVNDPPAAAKGPTPSPGTPGEGWGEGFDRAIAAKGPHPSPLPEYREREQMPNSILGFNVDESGPAIILTDPQLWQPRAEVVAKLGWKMARSGRFTDPLNLIPIYIRKPEAEEKWEQGLLQPK